MSGSRQPAVALHPAVALLQELVRIPSVSGAEEACRDHLAAWLDAHRIAPRIVGRNVLAVVEGEAPDADPRHGLVLCSHYDVVPAGSGWTRDPWDGALERGRLHGRGSNDAKSSVAAMCHAATTLDRARLRGRLVLAMVCDEETGGEGIEACLPTLPPVRAAVVGEPTGLDVCPGQRGLLRARVVVTGRACHASRPWEGTNAIDLAARDVLAIHALDLGVPDPLLGPATLQVTVIAGGTRPNVLPGECVLDLDGRPTPACDNAAMLARLRAAVGGHLVVRSERMTPVVTPPGAPLVRLAAACATGARVRAFGGVSDLFHLRHVPGVVLGPGTSDQSHAPDESVAVGQVEAAADVYARLAAAFLADADADAAAAAAEARA